MTVTCNTPTCPERGIAKPCNVELAEGEQVLCGGCAQPTQTSP